LLPTDDGHAIMAEGNGTTHEHPMPRTSCHKV